MSINGTLFVQMINFGIAYWMLRKFLFSPVVKNIMHEQAVAASMVASIEQLQEKIKDKEQQAAEYWLDCRDYLLSKSPDYAESSKTFFVGEGSFDWHIDKQVLSRDVVDDLAKRLVAEVLERNFS